MSASPTRSLPRPTTPPPHIFDFQCAEDDCREALCELCEHACFTCSRRVCEKHIVGVRRIDATVIMVCEHCEAKTMRCSACRNAFYPNVIDDMRLCGECTNVVCVNCVRLCEHDHTKRLLRYQDLPFVSLIAKCQTCKQCVGMCLECTKKVCLRCQQNFACDLDPCDCRCC